MSEVALYPHLIRDRFITREVNQAGIYTLELFIRGKPWAITIDDEILYNDDR